MSKIVWKTEDVPFECRSLLDLISEEYFVPMELAGKRFSLLLAAGQVLCLTANLKELSLIHI